MSVIDDFDFLEELECSILKFSGQTFKLQSEMRNRTTKMKDLVRTKVPEAHSIHKSSVFYLPSPANITKTSSRSVSVVDRGRRSTLDSNESSHEDKAIGRKTDNSVDSRKTHRRAPQRPSKGFNADSLNLTSQPSFDNAASPFNSSVSTTQNDSESTHKTKPATFATEKFHSVNLIDFDTVATKPEPPDPPMSFKSSSVCEEFDSLFEIQSNQSTGNGLDLKSSEGRNDSNAVDFNMDEELCSLFSNWLPSQSEVPAPTNGDTYSESGHSNDITGSSNLIQFSANNPFNF